MNVVQDGEEVGAQIADVGGLLAAGECATEALLDQIVGFRCAARERTSVAPQAGDMLKNRRVRVRHAVCLMPLFHWRRQSRALLWLNVGYRKSVVLGTSGSVRVE